jgi:hypothetical protein
MNTVNVVELDNHFADLCLRLHYSFKFRNCGLLFVASSNAQLQFVTSVILSTQAHSLATLALLGNCILIAPSDVHCKGC